MSLFGRLNMKNNENNRWNKIMFIKKIGKKMKMILTKIELNPPSK